MPACFVYCPGTLFLVLYALSHIFVDCDVTIKKNPTNDTDSLVQTSFPTILVVPLFLSQVG